MHTMKSKRSWVSFSLLAALLAVSPVKAHASGADDACDDDECSSFFAPEVIQNQAESPFFRSWRTFYQHAYDIDADAAHNLAAVNAAEWFQRFDGKIKGGTLSWMLYQMSLDETQNLEQDLEGKSAPLSDKGQVLLKLLQSYGQKNKVLSSVRYLVFAKKVEVIATRRSGEDGMWNPDKGKEHAGEDLATARELIAAAPAMIKSSDAFVAERLKMQVLRLMFYTNQFGEAQAYYDANQGSFNADDSAKWRFLETAAGAFYKDKKYGKANYLYSLVFGRFPSLKKSAYFSFHPMEQSDWKETLSLAKTSYEKETLWQLLGVYADGMAAIDQIYALNPKSDRLPLLLVREVNKAEEDWSQNYNLSLNPIPDNPVKPKKDADAVGVQRLARLRAIADAGLVSKPWLWRLAVGHLLALAGDQGAAEQYIRASANGMPQDPVVRGQARASLLLTKVRSLRGVNHGAEDFLAKELTWLAKYQSDVNFRAQNLNTWLLARLAALYKNAGDVTRSLMLTDAPGNPAYRDPAKVEAILKFQKTAHSAFDQFLVRNYQYKAGQLMELQALDSLYHGNFPAALDYLKNAGDEARNHPIYADPFTARIVDCHDCELKDNPVTTLEAFTEKMAQLAETAQGTGADAANASLLLGNAFYNMSYYGNGRAIYNTHFQNLVPDRYGTNGISDSDLALNQDMAEKFYNRAASLTSDKELRAKATFLAAKAEQNRWYNTHPDDDNSNGHAGKYFAALKASFSDTEYYKEVVNECGYFKKYVGQ
jgi:hypothetical protein